MIVKRRHHIAVTCPVLAKDSPLLVGFDDAPDDLNRLAFTKRSDAGKVDIFYIAKAVKDNTEIADLINRFRGIIIPIRILNPG